MESYVLLFKRSSVTIKLTVTIRCSSILVINDVSVYASKVLDAKLARQLEPALQKDLGAVPWKTTPSAPDGAPTNACKGGTYGGSDTNNSVSRCGLPETT